MEQNKVLVYGSSGYVGQLLAKESRHSALNIIPAGRNNKDNNSLFREFSLNDKSIILKNIKDVKLVINLAGPFKNTIQPLIEACIENGTHYIDISGEYEEFITTYYYTDQAKEAGIMLMPGAGFGVVPTDIVANLAKSKLPDATYLKIAYHTSGGASRGTLKTILPEINKQGVILENGNYLKIKPASLTFTIPLDNKKFNVVYNPWRADLFSARISTGIQNIQTYSNFPGIVVKMMQGKILWLRNFIVKYLINLLPIGPDEKQLKKGITICFAEVSNEKGNKAQASIIGPEAYLFTAQTLLIISEQIMKGNYKTGYQTPNIYADKIINSGLDLKIDSRS